MVSVIVPVYNGERTIRDCIESLLHLNYPSDRYEIIIVDNDSTDATATLVQKYPVKYVLENSCRARATARNAGARIATGDLLAFIDADCVADPLWLKESVSFLVSHKEIGSVGGRILSFQDNHAETLVERFQH